jgi:HEAT repeat protein
LRGYAAGAWEFLEDGDEILRSSAAAALGALGDARAVEPLLRALREDGDVPRYAAEALGAFLDHPDWFAPLDIPSDNTE